MAESPPPPAAAAVTGHDAAPPPADVAAATPARAAGGTAGPASALRGPRSLVVVYNPTPAAGHDACHTLEEARELARGQRATCRGIFIADKAQRDQWREEALAGRSNMPCGQPCRACASQLHLSYCLACWNHEPRTYSLRRKGAACPGGPACAENAAAPSSTSSASSRGKRDPNKLLNAALTSLENTYQTEPELTLGVLANLPGGRDNKRQKTVGVFRGDCQELRYVAPGIVHLDNGEISIGGTLKDQLLQANAHLQDSLSVVIDSNDDPQRVPELQTLYASAFAMASLAMCAISSNWNAVQARHRATIRRAVTTEGSGQSKTRHLCKRCCIPPNQEVDAGGAASAEEGPVAHSEAHHDAEFSSSAAAPQNDFSYVFAGDAAIGQAYGTTQGHYTNALAYGQQQHQHMENDGDVDDADDGAAHGEQPSSKRAAYGR